MNSIPADFSEWTASLNSDDRAGLLFAVIAATVGVIAIVTTAIYRAHRNRLEISFKREMLERGMTADEIVKVIEAAPPLEDGTQRWIASWGRRKA